MCSKACRKSQKLSPLAEQGENTPSVSIFLKIDQDFMRLCYSLPPMIRSNDYHRKSKKVKLQSQFIITGQFS